MNKENMISKYHYGNKIVKTHHTPLLNIRLNYIFGLYFHFKISI